MFENRVVVSPIEVIRQRDRNNPVRVPDDSLSTMIRSGVWIRQRSKQNRVDDAKDGRVRANAERERDNQRPPENAGFLINCRNARRRLLITERSLYRIDARGAPRRI